MIFLDVRQAFDRVWHEGLFYKLMPLLPEGLWKLDVAFLDNMMFAVDTRGHLSGLRQIRASVPQGSVLGPHGLAVHNLHFGFPKPSSSCYTFCHFRR